MGFAFEQLALQCQLLEPLGERGLTMRNLAQLHGILATINGQLNIHAYNLAIDRSTLCGTRHCAGRFPAKWRVAPGRHGFSEGFRVQGTGFACTAG